MLPKVFEMLKNYIDKKCEEAVSIILVPDNWWTIHRDDYLGLAAALIFPSGEKMLVVLGNFLF